jgi:FkbM family methyltransferase
MENYKFSAEDYWRYLKKACPTVDADSLPHIATSLESTSWDDPTSAIDLNNFAVAALIEVEQCQEASLREIYLEMAWEALNKGVELYGHPLCAAHLALVLAMTGEMQQAMEMAFYRFVNTLQAACAEAEKIPPGIVYLPAFPRRLETPDKQPILQILKAEDGYTQSLILLSEALCRSQLVFYNETGLRFLQLAEKFLGASISVNLKLGISSLVNRQWEGLLYLHRARQLAPDSAPIIQALYVAYRDLEQTEVANLWLAAARDLRQMNPDSLDWQWADLGGESSLTYVPFETDLFLAVEPSFRSYVTSVLIAAGDWFEKEMEFWRSWIKPGMTVIDVGANVGVYTFSAARRVGAEGRVLAVEPFSGCVRCLQESCRINKLSWVKVCAGAASDREGTARLSISSASELNEIVADEVAAAMKPGSFEEVPCFTLDSLIDRENLSQVDFLKIDAEGHEMSVLAGSERILSEFAPVILYENIAGFKESNLPVADYLRSRGYQFFRYQPYVGELIQINSSEEMSAPLNIIALPPTKRDR